MEERRYQEDAIEASLSILNSKVPCKELVVLPTGAGKSFVQAGIAERLDFPLVILCPSKELLQQNSQKLSLLGVEHSINSASLGERNISRITLATIGSIRKQAKEFKKLGVKGVIYDECHLGIKEGSMVRKFIKEANIPNVVGLTATPVMLVNKFGGSELQMLNRVRYRFFKGIRYIQQIKDIISLGYWSDLQYKVVDSDESFLINNSTGSDYTKESLKVFYEKNDIHNKILEEYKNLKKEGRKSTIIYVSSIEEAERLYKDIPNSAIVHSKLDADTRDFMVSSFKDLEIPVIINVGVLVFGFDHPKLDSMILGRATKSVIIYYQSVGRGVRKHKSKLDCKIVDLAGNFGRFGRVEELEYEEIEGYGWGLFGKDGVLLSGYPIGAKKRPTKESVKVVWDNSNDPVFYFGRFKHMKVSEVLRKPDGKSYLSWIADQEDFKWFGKHAENLRRVVFEALQLPIKEGHEILKNKDDWFKHLKEDNEKIF